MLRLTHAPDTVIDSVFQRFFFVSLSCTRSQELRRQVLPSCQVIDGMSTSHSSSSPSSSTSPLNSLLSLPLPPPFLSALHDFLTFPSPSSEEHLATLLPTPLPPSLHPLLPHLRHYVLNHPAQAISLISQTLSIDPSPSSPLLSSLSLIISSPSTKSSLPGSLPSLLLLLPPSPALIAPLNHHEASVRQATLTIIINLVLITRPLLRNTPSSLHLPSPYTPTPLRFLHAFHLLFLPLAQRILVERNSVALAKVARLVSLLFSVVKGNSKEKKQLIDALRARCFTKQCFVDSTSWAAMVRAVSVAVDDHMEPDVVNEVSMEVIKALKSEWGRVPVVECLAVLRQCIGRRRQLFERVWGEIGDKLMKTVVEDRGRRGVVLHFLKLVDVFLRSMAREEGEKGLWEKEALWSLYEGVLKVIARKGDEKERPLAIAGIESLLVICATDLNGQGKEDGISRVTKRIEHVVQFLIARAVEEVSYGTKIATLRALGVLSLTLVPKRVGLNVLVCLENVLNSEQIEHGVRGKALSASALFMERVCTESNEELKDMMETFLRMTEVAIEILQGSRMNLVDDISAAARSSIESSKIAAINVIVCSLRHHNMIWPGDEIDALGRNHIETLVGVLEKHDSVNIKCICCKAIEQVLETLRHEIPNRFSETAYADLVSALNIALLGDDVRLQLAAGRVLRDAMKNVVEDDAGLVASICLHLRGLRIACERYERGNVPGEKDNRRQLLSLQDLLSELIYARLLRADSTAIQDLLACGETDETMKMVDSLIDAVFRHLSIPRHLATHISDNSALERKSESAQNAQLLLDSLPEDAQGVVLRVTALREEIWKTMSRRAGG